MKSPLKLARMPVAIQYTVYIEASLIFYIFKE
jgi:hypothetical protein